MRSWRTTPLIASVIILIHGGGYSSFAGVTGQLTNITVIAENNQAGEETIYKFNFTTSASGNGTDLGIPHDGKIYVKFDPGFDLSQVSIAQSNSGITGGYSSFIDTSGTGVELFVQRDGTGNHVSVSAQVSISIGVVMNPMMKGNNYKIQIKTMTSANTHIDEGTKTNFSISPGRLGYILIEDLPNGNGGEISDLSLTAGQTKLLYAVGYDRYDNYINNINANWSVIGNIGNLNPMNNASSTTLSTTRSGTGQITADDGNGNLDNTGVITVNTASLNYVKIIEGTSGNGTEFGTRVMTTDQSLTVHAGGYDTYDNYIGDVSVNWSVNGTIGSMTPSTGTWSTLDATIVGTGKIIANHATVTDDQTDDITVNVGKLTAIKIVPGLAGNGPELTTAIKNAGDTLRIHVAGYDADGNYREDPAVNWQVLNGIGVVNPSTSSSWTSFIPQIAGTGFIKAIHSTAGTDFTDKITVRPGVVRRLSIQHSPNGFGSALDDTLIYLNETLTLYAAGLDDYDNYVRDVKSVWKQQGNFNFPDSLVESKIIFQPDIAGRSGRFSVDSTGLQPDTTGIIQVGDISYLKISASSEHGGAEFGDYLLSADDSLKLFAVAFDSKNNYLGLVDASWTCVGLEPATSGEGTSFIFHPTTAGLSGRIIAHHVLAQDDSTGLITIQSGVPAVHFRMNFDATELAANGQDSVRIISEPIRDRDGNLIESDNLFTVKVSPGNLGIRLSPFDASPSFNGHQVRTDVSGRIQFTLHSGTQGGTAFISANSVSGSAYSDTTIVLSSIQIISVSVENSKVSQSQDSVNVQLLMKNLGPSPIDSIQTELTFTDDHGENRRNDYELYMNQMTALNPGEQRVMNIYVHIKDNARTGIISIDARINGYIDANRFVQDTSATQTDSWLVQKPPELHIISVEAPEIVEQGTVTSVFLKVENIGEADAIVTGDSIVFNSVDPFMNVTREYSQLPTHEYPYRLTANDSRQLQYTVAVGANATRGLVRLDGKIIAEDANSQVVLMENGADTTDTWEVKRTGEIAVNSFITSQKNVILNQSTPWYVTIRVENKFETVNMTLDSAVLNFYAGLDDISSEFIVENPVSFEEFNRTDILYAETIETLLFKINRTTSQTSGNIRIVGSVYLSDIARTQLIGHGEDQITVKNASQLSVKDVRLSQAEVTRGQMTDWNIKVIVQNLGPSLISVDLMSDSSHIRFSAGSDFVVKKASGFHISGDSLIASGTTDTLDFIVDHTGQGVGNSDIKIQLAYMDVYALKDTFYLQAVDQIKVESQPMLRILKVANAAPNGPYVNTDQNFQIRVDVQNTGDDGVHDTKLTLSSNGNSEITGPDNFSVAGNSIYSVYVNALSENDWSYGEIFQANLVETKGDNTVEFDSQILSPAIDDTALAIIQRPAKMTIVDVMPEYDKVEALSKNWRVFVIVRREGAGWVRFDEPNSENLRFIIAGVMQSDYAISAPEGFVNSKSLFLSGWDIVEDTLVYTIDRTGLLGGNAILGVTLSGKYLNNDSSFVVQDTANLYVETTATLSIVQTVPVCPNIVDGTGVLSTEQAFGIRVTIQNSGDEPVDRVWVHLTSDDETYFQMIDSISARDQESIEFALLAPEIEKRTEFTAKIDSARSRLSGQAAIIGASYDSVAVVQIQEKARLTVKFNLADTVMTMGKLSFIRYVIENLGTAETDHTGKIQVIIPADYKVQTGVTVDSISVTRGFTVDRIDTLYVIPPNFMTTNDNFRITVSSWPKDVNTELPTSFEDFSSTITVKTVPSDIYVVTNVVWPNGAIDGTISTDQLFDVQSAFQLSDNIKEVKSTLVPPEGYAFDTGVNATLKVVNKKAKWRLRAPAIEHLSPKKVIVNSVGYAGQEQYVKNDTIPVIAEKKAQLNIQNVSIIEPTATDSVLSINQNVTLSATVINDGTAGVIGTGTLSIDFGNTSITTQDNLVKQYTVGKPVTWQAKAPAVKTPRSAVVVRIVTVPLDMNSNESAAGRDNRRNFFISTDERAQIYIDSLKIIDPRGATDRMMSTNQTFTVRSYLRWANCEDLPIVSLRFPAGFYTEIVDKYPIGTANQGVVNWTMKAPSVAVSNQNIWVEATAIDKNSGETIGASSNYLSVQVVRQAEIRLNAGIIYPQDAMDGIVSTGQSFTIRANLIKSGDAPVEDFYTVHLTLPLGQDYSTNDNVEQRVLFDEDVTWTITAPLTARDASIFLVNLIESPNDANTNESVKGEAVIEDTRALSITTEEKSVSISVLPRKANNSIARGDSSVAMLALQINISGDEASSQVLFSGIKLKLKDKNGEVISDPRKAISKIVVANTSADHVVLGEMTNIPAIDSLHVHFTQDDTLFPGEMNTIEFFVDISESALLTDFQLTIDSLSFFDMLDIGSGKRPMLVLSQGNTIESGFSVIVPKDFDKAFWNYPNPFGSTGRETTTIQYFLDQASNIEMRIYTLLGELVWSIHYERNEPQGRKGLHDGSTAIHWDASNGSGKRVLNGVYVAHLITDYGKSAITKIAVLK